MDLLMVRDELRRKPLKDIPLRVVYYARVSSEKDEQLNSLQNQKAFYEDYITANKKWVFCGGYIDEGLSGVTTSKRENFNAMIEAAGRGAFDLIITKEISRFARNTLDSIQYTRQLLMKGVGVYFHEDNINTLEADSEFRLTIMAAVAQQEVEKLSSRVRFGHNQAIKSGTVMGNSLIYGYKKEDGKLVIDEYEAEMVRKIFQWYVYEGIGTRTIETRLYEAGYRNSKGGMIDRNVIKHIITNPKYKGYYCGNKVKIVDMFTKKQKFLDEEDWVMWKDETGETVPAIVSEAIWNRANVIFAERSQSMKNKQGQQNHLNLFSGKIICAEHQVAYQRKYRKDRGANDKPAWVCGHKIRYGSVSCNSFRIMEGELVELLQGILGQLQLNYNDMVERCVQLYRQCADTEDFTEEIENLKNEISLLNVKKEKLLELNMEDCITNSEFKLRNDEYSAQIEEYQAMLKSYEVRQSQENNPVEQLKRIRNCLLEYANGDTIEITRALVDALIDKIYVQNIDERYAEIKVILKDGMNRHYALKKPHIKQAGRFEAIENKSENSEKSPSMENMVKKMIQYAEQNMPSSGSSMTMGMSK